MRFSAIAFAAFSATASASALSTRQASCDAAYNACRIGPNANQSYCASQYAACLGYNPFDNNGSLNTTRPVTSVAAAPTGTPAACQTAYDACRGAPNANFAYCASQYAGCLGYNPFDGNGSLNTTRPSVITQVVTAYTTYCPAATTITQGGKTYTVTGPTTLTITDCPCTITRPATTAPPSPTGSSAASCQASYDACRGAPDANFSYCASQYAACLGYNPFTNNGASATSTSGRAAGTTTPVAQYTGAAGSVQPALGLLALGALALL